MRPKKRLWEQICVHLVVVSSQEKEAAICEELTRWRTSQVAPLLAIHSMHGLTDSSFLRGKERREEPTSSEKATDCLLELLWNCYAIPGRNVGFLMDRGFFYSS